MPDDEYRVLAHADRRIAAVLRFARFAGPTCEIETIQAEIERGRS